MIIMLSLCECCIHFCVTCSDRFPFVSLIRWPRARSRQQVLTSLRNPTHQAPPSPSPSPSPLSLRLPWRPSLSPPTSSSRPRPLSPINSRCPPLEYSCHRMDQMMVCKIDVHVAVFFEVCVLVLYSSCDFESNLMSNAVYNV